MLAKMSIDQALMKAKSHVKKNEMAEAKKIYEAVLLAFPKNTRAQKGLDVLSQYKDNKIINKKQPSMEKINTLQRIIGMVLVQIQVDLIPGVIVMLEDMPQVIMVLMH